MPTAAVLNGGTYDLEIDVGFSIDALTLDSPNRGLLDSTYVLDGTTNYGSVTDGVQSVTIVRGRKDPADQFGAGTMTFVLDDTVADGVFGPFDTDSGYYDDITDYPGLAPGRLVRFTRYDAANVPERLFVGRIVNYDYQFQLGGLNTVTVFCADDLFRLASVNMTEHNPTKELTGARINAVLDRPEVAYPTGPARNIAPGTVELGGGSQYAIAEGTNVKAYFDEISYSAERGRIFVDRQGVLVSQDRIGSTLSAPSVHFSDTGDTPYNSIGITFKAEDLVNRVAVTPASGSQQVAEDLPSQATYFVRSLYIDGSLLHDNAAALDLASYLLYPEPDYRFDRLATWFGNLTASQRDACAALEIGDTVLIDKQVLIGGTPTTRSQEMAIEGIEHRISAAGGHTVSLFTSPTTIVYALILDDPVYGLLDQNALT